MFNQNEIENALKKQAEADAHLEHAQTQLDKYQATLNDLKAQQEDYRAQIAEGKCRYCHPECFNHRIQITKPGCQ